MDDTSGGRSKRQRVDKAAKFEKLKQLKGNKHKYEVTDVENVYEEVDEDTYTEKVLERQEDDWIVDDDGSGYVEDGREIFDDDLDEESVSHRKKGKDESRKRGRSKVEKMEVARPVGGNIRNLFANMPAKKRKECSVKLEDDNILGDLMDEIDNKTTTPRNEQRNGARSTPRSEKTEMSSRDYLKSFSKVTLKPKPVKASIVSTPRLPLRPPSQPKVNGDHTLEDVQSDEVPLIDDNFTEDCDFASTSAMDTDNTNVQIKQEPEDTKPVIEDFDSNDGFGDVLFNQVDKDIEEFESQAVEPKAEIKQEIVQGVESTNEIEDRISGGLLWDEMEAEPKSEPMSAQVDLSKLPLSTNEKGEKVFRFYYFDAYEDMFKQPGTVYLFGKVPVDNTYVSCCVVMKNIDRTIYLLPREEWVDPKTEEPTGKPVLQKDVYDEFNNKISNKYKIDKFRFRFVTKNYAFELDDVPRTCEYLEVRYSPNLAQIPKDLKGETFARVFGTNSSFLELLLLQRKIKGPCWLELSEPVLATNPVSNCKIEVVGSQMRTLSVSNTSESPPPLVLSSLMFRAALHEKTNQVQIIMVAVATYHIFSVDKQPNRKQPCQECFCAYSRPSDSTFPLDLNDKLKKLGRLNANSHRCNSERELLCFLLAKLSKLDPDLIVGHGLMNGDLNLLVQRLYIHKVPKWHRIGRLHRAEIPPPGKTRFQVEKYPMPGRLICDIKVSAKELIKSRSYDLGTLCQSLLKMKEDERPDITLDEVKSKYENGSALVELINCTAKDSVYVLQIMYELNVIPLALQITNIAGNVLSRTLMGGRAERNEFLLMHAFTEKDYIIPDKQYGKKPIKDEGDLEGALEDENDGKGKKGRRKKPQYSGGLVLDPKVGFYDRLVLLMDFNSLYPSIIHEYNICFTTVNKIITTSEDGVEVTAEPPDTAEELGILPTEIRKLVESRREVKKMMKASNISQDLRMQYDIRQMALKLTANSMYGCLGFSHSRFCAKPLAALVTAKGREILTNTKELVQKLSYEVIYGDTDSIMINTNILEFKEVFKIGNKIKSEVNKMYKHVELDIDGVFRFMLLLKKKKYAAVTLTQLPSGDVIETQEIKGLDIVRRDWSQLAAEAGKFVLKEILSEQDPDERIQNIHNKVQKLREDLEAGRVPLSLLTITKQLTRNPQDYSETKSQPHVLVALRMNKKGARLKAGDTVHYIICENETNNPAMQRAYHVDEMKSLKLKLDIKYYLAQQIHPVVTRLIEPIDGTSAAQIAQCLGLDPSQYKERPKPSEELGVGDTFLLDDAERFKHCDKFIFICANPECSCENVIDSPVRKTENGGSEFILERCENPDCSVQPLQYLPHILNRLTLSMRNYISKYYQGWLICEDPACSERTRKVPTKFENNFPVCSVCEINSMYREYSEKQLYTQLCYMQHVFDISKPPHSAQPCPLNTFNAYCTLKEHVSRTLACSDYAVVNLTEIFRGIYPEPIKIKQEPLDD